MLKRHCSSENQTKKKTSVKCGIGTRSYCRTHPRETSCGFPAEIQVCIQEMEIHNRVPPVSRNTVNPSSAITRSRSLFCWSFDGDDPFPSGEIVLLSSECGTVRLPNPYAMICHGLCDGLICIYCVFTPSIVVNPATRWQQSFPLSNIQQFIVDKHDKGEYDFPNPKLGFGKDKLRGIYKPVWLYNSSDYGFDNVITCEVFDFSTNTWRSYVTLPFPMNVTLPCPSSMITCGFPR